MPAWDHLAVTQTTAVLSAQLGDMWMVFPWCNMRHQWQQVPDGTVGIGMDTPFCAAPDAWGGPEGGGPEGGSPDGGGPVGGGPAGGCGLAGGGFGGGFGPTRARFSMILCLIRPENE